MNTLKRSITRPGVMASIGPISAHCVETHTINKGMVTSSYIFFIHGKTKFGEKLFLNGYFSRNTSILEQTCQGSGQVCFKDGAIVGLF